MERSSLVRGGGVAGLAGVGFLLAALILAFIAGYDREVWERLDLDTIMPAFQDSQTLWVISMWGFLLANILLLAFFLGLHEALPGRDSALGLAPWSVAVGVVVILFETVLTIGVVRGLADAYHVASGAERASLEAMALTMLEIRNHAYLLGFGLVAIGVFMFGLRILHSSSHPRWTGWTALIAAVLVIVGSLWPIASFLGFVLDAGLAVMLFGFILPASIALVRLRPVPESAPELQMPANA